MLISSGIQAKIQIDYEYKGDKMNARKKQIIDVAHRLFIEKGFASTSIQDILDGAKIAKGTFYNHFSSKNECLIAILEQVQNETFLLRKELSFGKNKDDQEVFIKQVHVRMKMNREHNLIALFQSVMHSKDDDLKQLMQKQLVRELKWTSHRFIDLFGNDVKQHVLDYSIIFFGIIQQMIHVSKIGTKNEYTLESIIRFSLQRVKLMILQQDKLDAPFFPTNWLSDQEQKEEISQIQLKKQIINRLKNLSDHMNKEEKNKKNIEYIEFLLSEFQASEPREFLITSVVRTVTEVFDESIYRSEVNDITELVHQYFATK